MKLAYLNYILLIAGLAIAIGCERPEEELDLASHGIFEKIEHNTVATPQHELSRESLLDDHPTVPVPLDSIRSYVKDDDRVAPFSVPERTSTIQKYPCNECHTKPLAVLEAQQADSSRRAHWDIEVVHAPTSVMDCATCHRTEDFNQLRLLNGQAVTYDHSYQLCGQCHASQLTDWIGGAHGKQVAGWAPPRVSQTCVSCHDAHEPAWDTRWPARMNTQVNH